MLKNLQEVSDLVSSLIPEHLQSIIAPNNFRNTKYGKNIYRFTTRCVSMELLEKLKNSEKVKDVLFHPSAPPPGEGMDGIASRYRVYLIVELD